MKVSHRENTINRQHYTVEKKHSYILNPRILYAGYVKREKGWREELHVHEFIEMILISGGSGQIIIEEKEHSVAKGSLIIYNSNIAHYEISSENDPLQFVFIALDNININDDKPNEFLPSGCPPIHDTQERYPDILGYFTTILNELSHKEPFYDEIAESNLKALTAEIYRLVARRHTTPSITKVNALYENIVSYINENYRENLTLENIATACNANRFYINHVFSKNSGTTITHYIMNKRMDHATNLLTNTNLTITQIALDSGFNNLNYFCRMFKKHTGRTPREYRKNNLLL